MEALDFSEIIKLLNHSRTTQFDLKPASSSKGNWDLYKGEYKVHLSKIPFEVLYLYSDASSESIKQAKAKHFRNDITQVVYAPSLDQRRRTHHEVLKPYAGSKFWTTKEYLISIFREELDAYRKKITQIQPKFYTNPPVLVPAGVDRKIPNPIYSLLVDPESSQLTQNGRLGIMLAEPGQGKTYMSQHLVYNLSENKKDIIPIYIDSNQWRSMSVDDLTSLWKTIAHSFRYFETPINWIEGCEDLFIKTTLKAGLFRVVFDGFDEYILRNHGRVQADEAIQALSELVSSTDARLIITSRTTFWESEIKAIEADVEPLEFKNASLFVIKPFDQSHAKNYFSTRLEGDELKQRSAIDLFRALSAHGDSFVGRGFVLNLIADLVSRNPKIKPDKLDVSPIQWLMKAICEREQLRQDLPIDANQQLDILQTFVADVIQGNPPNTETLDYAISDIAKNLDTKTRELCIAKLSPHPLINKTNNHDKWVIPQEQIKVVLLAEYILYLVSQVDNAPLLSAFYNNAELGGSLTNDLASMIIEISNKGDPYDVNIKRFRHIVECLLLCDQRNHNISERSNNIKILAVLISLKVVDKYVKKGSSRQDRANLLISMFPNKTLNRLPFSGAIASMDFRGVKFDFCRFDHVRWANCKFDQDTDFTSCHFIGGSKSNCEGFGDVKLINPTSDDAGRSFLNSSLIEAGKKQYTEDDLKSDINSVVSKFVAKGGLGFKRVTEKNLNTGTIRFSKYSDIIITEIKRRILSEHHISGSSDLGYGVKDEAKDSIRFFANNNVFTGILQEVFDRLKEKLHL